MTSSYRATGHASVRATPVSEMAPSGAWTLAELTMPVVDDHGKNAGFASQPAVSAEAAAAERAALIDEGYARGLDDGFRRGLAAGQSQYSEAVAVLQSVIAELREAAVLAPALLEENIAALSVIVARQIIMREVVVPRELVAELIRRALTEFPIDQAVRIRVNPVDLSVLTAAGSSTDIGPITGSREASWLADPRVARGGCLVEGRDRIVDGRVDTALERAYHRMAKIDAA